jgi:hypothetical protein
MNKLLSVILFSLSIALAGQNKTPYISLFENAHWSFKMNDHVTIIQVKSKELVGKISCYKVEWRLDNAAKPPMHTEFWYAQGDSILCAGIQGFGTTIAYPAPVLVIAETTKPGDSWKFVYGKGAFSDSVTFSAESYDSVYSGGKNIIALRIDRKGRGPTQSRWYARGQGIVMEETNLEGASAMVALQPPTQPSTSKQDSTQTFKNTKPVK